MIKYSAFPSFEIKLVRELFERTMYIDHFPSMNWVLA